MTNEDILKILEQFSDYLDIGSVFKDGLRILGMMFVQGLVWFIDTITGEYSGIVSFLGFRNDKVVNEILTTLRPIQNLILGVAILVVGIVLYTGKNAEVRNIPMNVFLIICTLSMLPNLITQGVRLTEAIGTEYNDKTGGLGFTAFQSNVTDVYELGGKGWTTTKLENNNYLESLKFFDINERIEDAKEVDSDGILDYKAVNKHGGKGYEVEKLKSSDSIQDFFIKRMIVPSYYRWKVFWIPTFLSLLALSLATGLFVIRAGKLILEMVFTYIWTSITAFAHIRDVRKFKQACIDIFVGLVVIASMFILFYLYIAYNTYISKSDQHMLLKALMYVGGAWMLFDGPAIIQKQLGIDAGLSTAGGIVAGMGAGKVVEGFGKVPSTIGKAAVTTAGFGAGALAELLDGQNNKKEPKRTDSDARLFNRNKDDKNDKNNSENPEDEKGLGINNQLDKNKDRETNKEKAEGDSSDKNEKDSSNGLNTGDTNALTTPTENESSNEELQGINENMDHSNGQDNEESEGIGIGQQTKESISSKEPTKNQEPEKPTKPKNPISSHISTAIHTPKYMKNSKGAVGNTIESATKGHALGKDLVRYTREKRQYKEAKKEYDTFKNGQRKDD